MIDIKKNIFLTDKQKKFVYFSYNNNIRLKNIVNNIEKKKIKTKCINKNFLDLTFTYKENDSITKLFTDIVPNSFYKFKNKELIQILYNNLILQDECHPTPKIPNNPYSGKTLTYLELSKCFMNFDLNKEKFLELVLFRNCNFDIDKLINIHYIYFTKCNFNLYSRFII